jgi:chemotaxis protein methyltransferase CheR
MVGETVKSSAYMAAPDQISPQNFVRLSRFIQEYSGIKMPPAKNTMLAVRLRSRVAALSCASLDEYCDRLFNRDGMRGELIHLINAVSTNKTDFFREPVHFDFIREHLLPEINAAGRREVKLWSAAASMGAEAYTLAMVADAFRRQYGGPDYSIIATDISTEMLALAIAGRYPAAMIEPVPMALRQDYILRSRDPRHQEVRMAPQLRAKLTCARLNLMDKSYGVGTDIDVIFLRNVLIYFEKQVQHEVLNRLCTHLRPGGYIVLGHSESGAGTALKLKCVKNTVFQKS